MVSPYESPNNKANILIMVRIPISGKLALLKEKTPYHHHCILEILCSQKKSYLIFLLIRLMFLCFNIPGGGVIPRSSCEKSEIKCRNKILYKMCANYFIKLVQQYSTLRQVRLNSLREITLILCVH